MEEHKNKYRLSYQFHSAIPIWSTGTGDRLNIEEGFLLTTASMKFEQWTEGNLIKFTLLLIQRVK